MNNSLIKQKSIKKRLIRLLAILLPIIIVLLVFNYNTYKVGQEIDDLNGVSVYYNGKISNVNGRNLTNDGYNLGLKYQCVEFVKRYYYEALQHKMPNSYGHAKDFFDVGVKDGSINKQRNLLQYENSSITKPRVDDLVVYSGTIFNEYGHVAIISKVTTNAIEIIQQNSGRNGNTRETYDLVHKDGKWKINNDRILGWLRKRNQ